MTHKGGTWWLMAPDCDSAEQVTRRVRRFACRLLTHASGRAWLLGCWDEADLVTAHAGGAQLAFTAAGAPDRGEREALIARLEAGVEAIPEALASVAPAGGFVFASAGGHSWARGGAVERTRVFHAALGGVGVAADRARTLAWLCDAALDEPGLALRLAAGMDVPHPLPNRSAWQGVSALGGECALRLDESGRAEADRWWHAPEPVLDLAAGAAGLREALSSAVAEHVRPATVHGADLSGGLDSTSVCFLAAHAGAKLAAITLDWEGAGNEDARWARMAAADLPLARHWLFGPHELPAQFEGLERGADPRDEPFLLRDAAQQALIAGLLREAGASVRWCGHGGDHVVQAPWQHLSDLMRRHPLRATRLLRGYSAQRRWPLRAALGALLRPGSYPGYLAATADQVASGGSTPRSTGPQPWGETLRLPPWTSQSARATLAELLRDAAADPGARPLAAAPWQHALIHQVRVAGRSARLLEQVSSEHGVRLLMPFCDDRVLAACLAVRPEHTASPFAYKPLLSAAMRDLVPARQLTRTTKDHCAPAWYQGVTAQRGFLTQLAERSSLVEHGLVDPVAWRRALTHPQLVNEDLAAFENSLGVELWLRDLAAHRTPGYLHTVDQHGADQP